MDILTEQLKFEEGLRLTAYLCPTGHKTIGYGHNLEARPFFEGNRIPDQITKEVAEVLLHHDIEDTSELLDKAWHGFLLLHGARSDAVINMAYQMGVDKFMGFKRMRDALIRCDWQTAYNEAMASAWARQTPGRAERVATQFRTGEHYVPGAIAEHF